MIGGPGVGVSSPVVVNHRVTPFGPRLPLFMVAAANSVNPIG